MKIKFDPINKEIDIDPNKTLLQICIENRIEIKSICKGVPSCAECRVKITEGEHNINPPSRQELNLIGTSYYLDGRRLSCQVRCFGNVTVDLSEQIERAETQTKKVRGFKVQGANAGDSKALQGTMILDEVKSSPIANAVANKPNSNSPKNPKR